MITGDVERFVLPNLNALNFLLHGALDGGGTLSLKTDAQGKVYSTALLRMVLDIPDDEAKKLALPPAPTIKREMTPLTTAKIALFVVAAILIGFGMRSDNSTLRLDRNRVSRSRLRASFRPKEEFRMISPRPTTIVDAPRLKETPRPRHHSRERDAPVHRQLQVPRCVQRRVQRQARAHHHRVVRQLRTGDRLRVLAVQEELHRRDAGNRAEDKSRRGTRVRRGSRSGRCHEEEQTGPPGRAGEEIPRRVRGEPVRRSARNRGQRRDSTTSSSRLATTSTTSSLRSAEAALPRVS